MGREWNLKAGIRRLAIKQQAPTTLMLKPAANSIVIKSEGQGVCPPQVRQRHSSLRAWASWICPRSSTARVCRVQALCPIFQMPTA